MAVTPTTLKALFPEFSADSDTRVQLFIDMAGRKIDADTFGTVYEDALHFLAAHMLTKANSAKASNGKGLVSSETVGDLSRSYVQHGGVLATGYSTTPYGVEFLKLRQRVVGMMVV